MGMCTLLEMLADFIYSVESLVGIYDNLGRKVQNIYVMGFCYGSKVMLQFFVLQHEKWNIADLRNKCSKFKKTRAKKIAVRFKLVS